MARETARDGTEQFFRDRCAQCGTPLDITKHVPGNMGICKVECPNCGATGKEEIREASPGPTFHGEAYDYRDDYDVHTEPEREDGQSDA